MPATLAAGRLIERYVVEELIGEGGTAVVYRVRHVQLGTLHALKVLSLSGSQAAVRLLLEGRVQAGLRHPNIVAVTDVLDIDGVPGLLMEYIPPPSLARWIGAGPNATELDALFRDVVAGVRHAHLHGLVHRDLKPSNVLLTARDPTAGPAAGLMAKVADFGLAKLLSDDPSADRTRSGLTMGTPQYMAPEQFRDAKNVDRRADMFSLGCILYELHAGEPPFPWSDLIDLYERIRARRYRPVPPAVPEAVRRAIEGCLEPDANARIGDCATLLAVLDGRDAPPLTLVPRPDATPFVVALAPRRPPPVARPPAGETAVPAGESALPSARGPVGRVAPDVVGPTRKTTDARRLGDDEDVQETILSAGVSRTGREPVVEDMLRVGPAAPTMPDEPRTLPDAPSLTPAPASVVDPAPRPRPRSPLLIVGIAVAAAVALATTVFWSNPPLEPAVAEPEVVPAEPEPLPPEPSPPEVVPDAPPIAQPVAPVVKPRVEKERPKDPVVTPVVVVPQADPPKPEVRPPDPPVEVEAPSTVATIRVTGARSAWVVDAQGTRHPVPGRVAPGRYDVRADFGAGGVVAGTVQVLAGETVSLECNESFQTCQARR